MEATIERLQKLREQIIREIDFKFEQVIHQLRSIQADSPQNTARPVFESILPLHAGTGIFKGKKVSGILFPDGRRVDVPTWKRLVEEILKDCDQNAEYHRRLMDLRGKVLGRDRVLLGNQDTQMHSPVKINRALYVETHYDAETLLRILTVRILDVVGYDYSGIQIAVRNG